MKKTMFLLLFLSIMGYAQAQNDSIKTYNLDEVVVEGAKQYAINDGVACIPTKKIKQHSMNVVDMLSKMMLVGLHVDMSSNKVETSYRGEVHFFIDGVEAQDWEVNALNPKDVLRIEYLQSPVAPKYRNYMAVVDFIMAKYKYGGYVVTEANQSFIANTGNYGAILKVKHNKWSYQGFVEANYNRADDIITRQSSEYLFSPDEIVGRVSESKEKEHKQRYTGAFNTRYDSDKLILSISAGCRSNKMPLNESQMAVTYTWDDRIETTEGSSEYTSNSLTSYLSTYFQLSKLPRNSILYGNASFSYNHNDASGTYTLDTPIFNGSKENVWLPRFWLSYMFPLYKQNYMTITADWTSEVYKTHYSGTENSFQKLINNYLYLRVGYRHTFNDKWGLGGSLEMPVNSYKVNDGKFKTTPFVNGSLTLNGKVNSKNSIYSNAQISQIAITPNYYNTAVRQDNEIEGIKGNADLKTQRYLSALFTYSWIPINKFSLNTTVMWEQILDDIVPSWYPSGSLMVKDMMNSGNYNILSLNVTPSLSLFDGKLNLQSMLYYAHETHSGIVNISLNTWGLSPYASYMINTHFSVSANYNKFFNGSYMRGGSSTIAEFSDKLRLSAQYTTGNFFAQLTVNSLNRKDGWVKSRFNSAHFHNREYLSRPWDGRYVSLKLRYTFNFGRKMQRGNDPQFEGSVKSSVL